MQRVLLAPDAAAPPGGGGDTVVDPDDLCISAGCGAILDNLFLTITSPGDGVLIPAPYYPAFDNDLRVRNGTRALPVNGDSADALPTPSQLESAIAKAATEGCEVKALLLTNPSNPLGIVYSRAELTAAMTWALDKGLHVVVDEVYASSVFATAAAQSSSSSSSSSFVSSLALEASLPAASKCKCETRLHLVYGLSKDFCASGYRVGVLRTRNKAIIRAMDNVAYFCTVPGPMQYAVAEMLEDKDWVDGYLELNAKNLAESHATLSGALADAGVPVVAATAGMFVWIDLGKWLKERTFEEESRLWTACFENPKCKLVMTPGRDCKHDVPGCFRMCFAAVKREALPVAAKRLAAMLSEFKSSSSSSS